MFVRELSCGPAAPREFTPYDEKGAYYASPVGHNALHGLRWSAKISQAVGARLAIIRVIEMSELQAWGMAGLIFGFWIGAILMRMVFAE
jgi:hypothetical protein